MVNEGDVFQYNLLKNVGDIKKYMTNIIQTFWYSQMNWKKRQLFLQNGDIYRRKIQPVVWEFTQGKRWCGDI